MLVRLSVIFEVKGVSCLVQIDHLFLWHQTSVAGGIHRLFLATGTKIRQIGENVMVDSFKL